MIAHPLVIANLNYDINHFVLQFGYVGIIRSLLIQEFPLFFLKYCVRLKDVQSPHEIKAVAT